MRVAGAAAAAVLVLSAGWVMAGEPGWTADSRTGCKIWNIDPQPGESITWSGRCENGLAQGPGVVAWFDDGKPGGTNEGTWRDGKMQGRAVLTWPSGNRFEGEIKDGIRSGKGVFIWANGGRYEGEYQDDQRTGFGVQVSPRGDRYEGQWRNGKRSGHGVEMFADGARFEGEFRDGKPNGPGVFTDGTGTYEGDWRSGCLRRGNKWMSVDVPEGSCG